jgi:hypothetical protein
VRPALRDLAQRVLLPRLRDNEGAGVGHGRCGGGGGGFVSRASPVGKGRRGSGGGRGISSGCKCKCKCNGRGRARGLKKGWGKVKSGFAHLSGATVGIFSSCRNIRVSLWALRPFLVRLRLGHCPVPTVDRDFGPLVGVSPARHRPTSPPAVL